MGLTVPNARRLELVRLIDVLRVPKLIFLLCQGLFGKFDSVKTMCGHGHPVYSVAFTRAGE
jgi:hypothetical protein